MSLRATRIAEGLPDLLDAAAIHRSGLRVHSVHRPVVNLIGPHGRLVAVAADDVGGLPDGILVAAAPDFTTLGLRPGDAASWAAGELRFGDRGLTVRVHQASTWSPRIARRDVASWTACSTRAWELGLEARSRGGLLDLPGVPSALATLDRAIRDGDPTAATRGARGLIGLGPGLTPSGDDALAGIACALHAAGHPMAGFLEPALIDVEARTTTVSVALLRHAVRGAAAERVHRLVDGLVVADPAALRPAIAAAANYGATSGSDLLLGILLGLDAATGVPASTAVTTLTAIERVAA